jgi:hypothetical protein
MRPPPVMNVVRKRAVQGYDFGVWKDGGIM